MSWCRDDVKDDHTSVKTPDIMVVNCALSYIPKDNMKVHSQLIRNFMHQKKFGFPELIVNLQSLFNLKIIL